MNNKNIDYCTAGDELQKINAAFASLVNFQMFYFSENINIRNNNAIAKIMTFYFSACESKIILLRISESIFVILFHLS